MSGFITVPEVLANRQFIIESWGHEFYNACVNAGLESEAMGETKTFLGLLAEFGLI